MTLGQRIQKIRKEKGFSQEEIAEALEVSRQAVSKWETGTSTPDISLLPKIATYFGGKAGYLAAIRELEEELYKAG